jgi:hypothetical protein
MFVELMTMWKKPGKKPENKSPDNDNATTQKLSLWRRLQSSLRRKFHRSDKEQATTSTWHRRRIGVLYSKQGPTWIYIVLIPPGDDELKFCYRIIRDKTEEEPNCHCSSGLKFYQGGLAGIPDLINHFTEKLKDHGPHFLEEILQDVFWGWEEFLTHVRSQTMLVYPLFVKMLTLDTECMPVEGDQLFI